MPRPAPRGTNPFDSTGVQPDGSGVRRYAGLHDSLVAMLRDAVDAQGQTEALAELGGERISYQQLWDRAARVAGGLRARGIRPGDRVAIRLPNSIDWVLAFFGGLLAGAIVVPVNTRFTADEAGYVVTDSGSSLRFEPGEALPDGRPYAREGARQSDVAAIFYTSGTTGFPKGAMHTHENVLANIETALRVVDIPRDVGAPGVGEVAVVGVADPMMGEKVGAVIVPLPGSTVDPQAVVAYAREHLADFKVPQFVAVRSDPLRAIRTARCSRPRSARWISPARCSRRFFYQESLPYAISGDSEAYNLLLLPGAFPMS